jgi:hypothetical protein
LYAHSHNVNISEWEDILLKALHSIRSLLCTATNSTPHERLFSFQRRPGSINSKILPTWLINPGPVLLRNFERSNKNDIMVRRVELLEANPNYAIIRDGRGVTKAVSVKDLAPVSESREKRIDDASEVQGERVETSEELLQDAGGDYGRVVEVTKKKIPTVSLPPFYKIPTLSLPRLTLPKEFIDSSEQDDHVDVDRGAR